MIYAVLRTDSFAIGERQSRFFDRTFRRSSTTRSLSRRLLKVPDRVKTARDRDRVLRLLLRLGCYVQVQLSAAR